MNDIDFLPQKYRDNDARRKEGLWRLLVALLFGGVVAAASVGQLGYRASVQSQLEQVQPMLAQVQAREAHLAKLHSELADVNSTANLHALVQAPWPRTQILAAIVEPLEGSIVLEEISVARRKTAQAATARSELFAAAKQPHAESLSPARRDLEALKTELFERRAIVSLSGLTTLQSQLHAYLARLESAPLLARVELLEVDSVSEGRLRFRAQAEIRPPLGRSDRDNGQSTTQAKRNHPGQPR